METVGEHLKRVRKTCGYRLEDVAHVTKINLRYLEAIENEEFSKLPGETFLQGFVRSYARFLGINEQDLINEFKERKRLASPPVDIYKEEEDRGIRDFITSKNIKIILPLGAGVIALLIIIIIFAGGRETSSIQNSKEIKETSVTPVEVKPMEVQPDQAVQPVTELVSLNIYAKEPTWIRVKIDEKILKEVLLNPGEKASWRGEDKITMTIGNAGGVEMEINGERHEPFGKSGGVVKDIVITKAGVSKGVTVSSKQTHIPVNTVGNKLEGSDQKPEDPSPLMNPPP